jgi:aminopeptidase YwaD
VKQNHAHRLAAPIAVVAFAVTASLAVHARLPERAGIRASSLREAVTYLASDALAGRGSGMRGNELAARYIADRFARAGLKPLGSSRQTSAAPSDGSGYFQPFSFNAGVERGRNNSLQTAVGGKNHKYRAGTEFEPSSLSASGRAEGEAVFVGYGIVSKDPARDDYAGLDVKGKIVVMVAGIPGNDPHSPLIEASDLRRKAITARDRGASAIIVMPQQDSDSIALHGEQASADAGLPVLLARRGVVDPWLRSGPRPTTVDAALRDGGTAVATGVSVNITTDVVKVRKTSANIAGLLEGSDPALKDEVVVIGAHMDHLGMGGPGSLSSDPKPAIHHGADDNASGTAAVLALAEYFSSPANRPKRSILFICFSGEELGLLGSAHYVKKPLVPLDRTAAMINMDMIGRMQNNKLIVSGTKTSPAWEGLLDELNRPEKFSLFRNDEGFGASDQQSFYLAGVPVLFFFTGVHADYHKPSDTADKINAEDEARIVEFVAACAQRIANSAERPAFQKMAAPTSENAPARFRVSLGSIPDYAAEVEGVRLSGVRPGSPAEKAGLKEGDVIIKFGERTIRNVQEYTVALSERKPGDVVDIVVKRGSETLTLKATLAGSNR